MQPLFSLATKLGVALLAGAMISGCAGPRTGGESTPLAQAANSVNPAFEASQEELGKLRLGLPGDRVLKVLPGTPLKSRPFLVGATGELNQTWSYPQLGIELNVWEKTVNAIRARAPSDLKTSRGVGIGSSVGEVVQAYGDAVDPNEPASGMSASGDQFVAGSVYDGVFFLFREGVVTEIFIGAGAG